MLRHVNPILQGKEKVKTGEGPTDSLQIGWIINDFILKISITHSICVLKISNFTIDALCSLE